MLVDFGALPQPSSVQVVTAEASPTAAVSLYTDVAVIHVASMGVVMRTVSPSPTLI